MMTRRCANPIPRRLIAALFCLSACTGVEPGPRTYESYAGPEAFPNRRAPFTLPRGDVGFVSNSRSDSIDLVDLTRGVRLGSVPIGRNPVDIDGPHHLVIDPQATALYTALSYPDIGAQLSGPHDSHGSSARLGYLQRLSARDLTLEGELILDENPGDVAISADGAIVIVSHFDLARARKTEGERRANLIVATAASLLQRPVPDPVRIRVCRAPHGVALRRPEDAIAYVACYADDAVAVVDLKNPTAQVKLYPLGRAVNDGNTPAFGPYSVVLSPSGTWLAVGNTESKTVHVFDAKTMVLRGDPIQVGGAAYYPTFSPDETRLYVPIQNPDGLRELDLATGATITYRATTPTECQKPHEVGLFGNNTALYMVCEGDQKSPSQVRTFGLASLEPQMQIGVGAYPDRLAHVVVP
jgi:DNA-binding beta-propeller fold protein YncE